MSIYRELMNKTERELVATYMENHDTEYILQNYEEVAQLLTTPQLRNNFLSAVQILGQELSQDSRVSGINLEDNRINIQQTREPKFEMPEGYSINEFGEIIRPGREETQEDNNFQVNDNKLSFRQRIAQFLQRNSILMNVPFVEKFVNRQLNVLPPANVQRTSIVNSSRESFLNFLSNNGEYRNLPPIQRMSDPERMETMRRKMEQGQQTTEDNERD